MGRRRSNLLAVASAITLVVVLQYGNLNYASLEETTRSERTLEAFMVAGPVNSIARSVTLKSPNENDPPGGSHDNDLGEGFSARRVCISPNRTDWEGIHAARLEDEADLAHLRFTVWLAVDPAREEDDFCIENRARMFYMNHGGLIVPMPLPNYRECLLSAIQTNVSSELPLCPETNTEGVAELERMLTGPNFFVSTLKESIDGFVMTNEEKVMQKKVATISYWSPSAERHVVVPGLDRIFMQDECERSGPRCASQCFDWAKSQLGNVTSFKVPENLTELALWDRRDHLCRIVNVSQVSGQQRKFGGQCEGDFAKQSTCLTPEAQMLKTTWPWKNESQHKWFFPSITYTEGIPDYRSTPMPFIKRKLKMEHEFRQVQFNFSCPVESAQNESISGPRLELSELTQMDGQHHMIFFPESKLIFCGIPKVGITEWLKFQRFTFGAGDFLSWPHQKQDREYFMTRRLPRHKAEELLNDPSWTKAVFFRDPAERLLSAYLDKVIHEQYDLKFFQWTNKTLWKDADENGTEVFRTSERMPFKVFVDRVTSPSKPSGGNFDPGLSWTTDPHWRPQTMMCGLDVLLPRFDFIGSFQHIAEHTRMLLERVGLWETHGKHFTAGPPRLNIGNRGIYRVPDEFPREGFMQKPKDLPAAYFKRSGRKIRLKIGNRDAHAKTPAQHATGSGGKMDEFYTPELLARVRSAYAWDQFIWNDLSQRVVADVPKGRDLNIVKEECGYIDAAQEIKSE